MVVGDYRFELFKFKLKFVFNTFYRKKKVVFNIVKLGYGETIKVCICAIIIELVATLI